MHAVMLQCCFPIQQTFLYGAGGQAQLAADQIVEATAQSQCKLLPQKLHGTQSSVHNAFKIPR